jgi:glutamate-1-semialdehyde 2,1-aminomutase
MGDFDDSKRSVLDHCQRLARAGYLIGTGGNVSVRVDGLDALAITPSSRDYPGLVLDDICVVDWTGRPLEPGPRPSVETAMHAAVYQNRPDVNAVVHTHQPYASALGVIGEPIPALFDEQVLNLGNVVEIVPYAVSGSVDLLELVVGRLDNQCNAYILQNHGALCLGLTIEEAARNVELLEKSARVYCIALSTGREIVRLPAEMEEAIFEIHKSEQRKAIRRGRRAARAEPA